jgi:hypothetical protein
MRSPTIRLPAKGGGGQPGKLIRPIHSGVLVRRGEPLPPSRAFTEFLLPAGEKKTKRT